MSGVRKFSIIHFPLSIGLLLLLLLAAPAHATTVSDSFTRGDSTDVGTNWDAGYSGWDSCRITSNKVRQTSLATTCGETWNANAFAGNQTAKVTIVTIAGSVSQPDVKLKASAPATATFYRCVARRGDASAKTRIQKWVAGSIDSTSVLENTSGGWANGDELACEARASGGNVIVQAFKNGFPVLTYTDSHVNSAVLSGTRIGIGCIADDALGDCEIDDFSGGDLSAGTQCNIKADATGKYLQTQAGSPYFWLGDTAKDSTYFLTGAEIATYFSTRAAQGFTNAAIAVRANPVYQSGKTEALPDLAGKFPWGTSPDITKPDPAWWTNFDLAVTNAVSNSMMIQLSPFWAKSANVDGDPYLYLTDTTTAENYGIYLGRRYRDQNTNIIWLLGGDINDPSAGELLKWDALAKGIAEGVSGSEDYTKTCISAHLGQVTAHSSGTAFNGKSYLTFNSFQNSNSQCSGAVCTHNYFYSQVGTDLALAPAHPTGNEEGDYEDVGACCGSPALLQIRQGAWATRLAGGHYTFGNGNVWCFGRGSCGLGTGVNWSTALTSTGAVQMGYLKSFLTGFAWQTLSVDQTIFTAGCASSGTSMCVAAKTAAGDRAVIYLPTVVTVTVDMTKITSAPNVLARWYDPTADSYVTVGTFANTGTQSFNPGGSNDRVLVLTASSAVTASRAPMVFQ